ncbi:hypothetical protein NDU88_003057 [Pleurodeles waltl]|uniref:Uncharacterized protein n=1 Tax=Pleurodeles waltl TaxID=8319 RepID=A0AAV7T3P3_PLEWA|nr:hypothetical protein NDU88_003057 [Pleurodeles waltl]
MWPTFPACRRLSSYGSQMSEMQLSQPLCKRLHGWTHQGRERMTYPTMHGFESFALHVEARNRSSSTDSGADSTREANKHLYLMLDAQAQERTSEHVQLVDKRQIKKMMMVELQVRYRTTQFVLNSRATCNIMCMSEYKKMKSKPPLSSSTVDMFMWGVRQPVVNMGKFVETVTYNETSIQEEVHVLQGDVPVPCLQVMGLLVMTYHSAECHNIFREYHAVLKGLGKLNNTQVTLHIKQLNLWLKITAEFLYTSKRRQKNN